MKKSVVQITIKNQMEYDLLGDKKSPGGFGS